METHTDELMSPQKSSDTKKDVITEVIIESTIPAES